MTDLDLGGMGGNPNADLFLQEAYDGSMMPEIQRRQWGRTANDDGGFVSSAVGTTAAMGKGIADAGLGLARGLAWLGTAGQYDTSQMPQTLYDLLPEEGANNLASRIARANIGGETEILGANVGSAGEMTGQMLAILGGGGLPGGAAGKGADLLSKGTKAFTLPGQAIKALSFPGRAAGAKLAAIPQVAQWTRTAKILPEMLGGASGFGLYNFVTQDGAIEERAGAMLHGMAAGAGLSVMGRIASAAEAKILDKAMADKVFQIGKTAETMRLGRAAGGWGQIEKAAAQVMGRSASTLIEGTGFAMLDQRFWDAAVSGDMEKAVGAYVESLPAALLARTGRMDAWKGFRRDAPDLNNTALRQEIIATRRGQQAQEPQGGEVATQPRDVVDGVPRPPERDGLPLRQHRIDETPMIPKLKPGQKQIGETPMVKGPDAQLQQHLESAPNPMAKVGDPLIQSGWEIPEGVPAENTIELEFPGLGSVTLEFPNLASAEPVAAEGKITVPKAVFEAVRGTEFDIKTETVEMSGPIAEEFSRDLAAVSMMRRMGGELRFQSEAWAGGPWKSGDGRLLTVGIDGKTYSKSYPPKAGEKWVITKDQAPDVSMEPQTPEQARWRDFAEALRGTSSPNPGLDLIETSVATAINGNPESPSVMELNKFFQGVSPDQLAQMLTPANLEHVGLVLGQIGSGHLTAEDAGMRLEQALSMAGPEMAGAGAPPQEPPPGEGQRMGEPGDPEAGAVDLSGVADVAKGGASLVEKGVKGAKKAVDYAYESRANEISQVVPNDTFAAEYRTTLSNRRVLRGEAHALSEPSKKAANKLGAAWRKKTEPSAEGAPNNPRTAVWEMLGDKKRKPSGDQEQAFQDSWQEGLQFLWNKAREVGTVRDQKVGDTVKTAPLPKRATSVTQRIRGADAEKVYESHELRRKWFETLEALNPGETTARKLENQYNPPASKTKTSVDTPDIGTALEHTRNLKNVPHTFEVDGVTYEMREMDPRQVMSKIIEEQTANIATNKTWGQDLTDKQRGQARQSGDPAVLQAMERRGVADRAARVKHAAKESGDFSVMDARTFDTVVDEAVQIAQGGSPGKINRFMGVVRDLDAVPRAFLTMKAPIYDIPELLTQPALYGGIRRALKALYNVFGNKLNPMEAIAHYERMGAISSKMTSLMFEEARGIAGKLSKWAGAPGELSERIKGAVVASTADAMLEDWASGKQSGSTSWLARSRMVKDADLVAEMEFTPQEQTDLLTGRFSEELGNKFRNEFVQKVTARAEQGEGPRAADNPNLTAMLRFQRLMSMRTGQTVHRIKKAIEATKTHGAKSKAARRAWGRLWGMVGMHTAVTGTAALALMIALQQLLRGEPEEIGERIHREMVKQPFEMLKDAAMRQVVGGPAAVASDTMGAATGERAARGLAAPVDQILGIRDVIKTIGASDKGVTGTAALAMGELLKQLHYVPLESDMKRLVPRVQEWATAAITGEELSLAGDAISDRDRAMEFLRGPGKDAGLLGIEKARSQFEPGKTATFYDGVHKAMKEFWRGTANGGEEEGLRRATATIETMIKEIEGASPKSISAWIRSQRTMSIIGKDKIAEFYDFVGHDTAEGIVTRDGLLAQFATAVGRFKGEPMPDWSERIEELRKTAALGIGDWDPVLKEAIGSAAQSIAASQSERGADWRQIEEIAPVVASSDALILKVFPGQKGEWLAKQSPAGKVRYSEMFLQERARNAAMKSLSEAAKPAK